jgi:hypothetical protein
LEIALISFSKKTKQPNLQIYEKNYIIENNGEQVKYVKGLDSVS